MFFLFTIVLSALTFGSSPSAAQLVPSPPPSNSTSGTFSMSTPSSTRFGDLETRNIGIGQISVYDSCPHSVHYAVVGPRLSGPLMTLNPEGSGEIQYQQTVSIKLAAKPELVGADHILEFEHNLNPETGYVSYDLSYVTANTQGYKPRAFLSDDLHLVPQGAASPLFPTSTKAFCKASEIQCSDAYKWDHDDAEMRTCFRETSLVLQLCSASQPQKRMIAPGRGSIMSKASSNVPTQVTLATLSLALLASAFWMFG